MTEVYTSLISTPFGKMQLFSINNQLVQLLFENEVPGAFLGNSDTWIWKTNPCLKKAENQIEEFLKGQRTEFDLDLYFYGTDFQKNIWLELQKIPFGKKQTYTDIAVKIQKPKAVRAVGGAIGKNPIPFIVPCHRVIGANGKLTGFLGGLELKAKLLQFESQPS